VYNRCLLKLVELVEEECRGLRAYLAGNVLLIARGEDDVAKYLYATVYPPYVKLADLTMQRLDVVVTSSGNIISISGIKSFELAAVLASTIARELEELMPFRVEGVDLLTAYRSSEDGGIYTRHEVRVYLKDENVVGDVLELIRRILSEFKSVSR